jgi:glycosyltransferase involved in cell wall biosynthesis
MNILILNWRDPLNPRSGGAEIITRKYADYWAASGHKVTWMTNTFRGRKSNEIINGVKYLRTGPELGYTLTRLILTYPVFLIRTFFFALQLILKERFDLIIDEIHGVPFFTPLLPGKRKVLLVCEVAGPIWDKMFSFPINIVGRICERIIYCIYNNCETWAISQHTAKDILSLNGNRNIKVLPLGIDPPEYQNSRKYSYPSAVFLGRLVRMKGLESAIRAAGEIVIRLPEFKLYVIGTGSSDYIKNLNTPSCVVFLGRLSDREKYSYLSKSHFLIHPSYKEGFGLTILEAGLYGTPAIARKGSSLDELVIDKQTGFLFENDSEIASIFINNYNSGYYPRLSGQCRSMAETFHWDKKLKQSKDVTGII